MSHEEKNELSRRQFLGLSAATLGTELLRAGFSAAALAQDLQNARTLIVPDEGWRLWPDVDAEWKDDPLFLPDEVDLDTLPVNLPTGGWASLNADQGISVTLPTSVEEHFWGKIMSRPYHERDENREYEFAGNDSQVKNGAYRGVAWFWRAIDVPQDFAGRLTTLRIRNFRQRVEVFCNGNLAGYDLIAETAYSCDVTRFLKPGQPNLIAIRITNPGGIYDWRDFTSLRWGKYVFQAGRGFGGLDRGMTLVSHDPVHFEDAWVLNKPDLMSVVANARLSNKSGKPVNAVVHFSILERKSGKELFSRESRVRLRSGETSTVSQVLRYPEAQIWSVDSPSLYVMQFRLIGPAGDRILDSCERTFGFRWFTPEGIGTNARLTFNGQRIRLYSAIEFGFWGFNGLWPSAELADKQVKAAKAFGLNALQYHRNLAKQEAIDADDRLGLIRYMEPGGGWLAFGDQGYSFSTTPTQPPVDASGDDGAARTFSERYTEWRIRRMIRDFRSHPSLVMYCVQNEINPDLHNKRIFRVMKVMHEEDPSRTIILHSGPNVANQVFYLPYDDQVHFDNGLGYSGWADVHTVAGPGVWQDSLYVDPRNYTQSSNNFREVSVHGEMLGWASADNHELIVENIRRHGGQSYDLHDHEAPLQAYADFLQKWGFQKAFPTPGALFVDIGNKVYDAWSKILPIIRLSEASDYLVINGWETQAIDNHSGLVDNQRNFKGDPTLIAAGLALLRPLAQPRGLVHKLGDRVLMDLFLLNETGRNADGELRLTLVNPNGKSIELGSYGIPKWDRDRFVYPIKEGVQTPPLTEAGHYKVQFRIDGNTPAQGDSDLFIVDPFRSEIRQLRIGVIGSLCALQDLLEDQRQILAEIYNPAKKYDVLVALEESKGWSLNFADAISSLQVALFTSVRSGTPLLVLANGLDTADQYAKTLDQAGCIHYRGMVGQSRLCWMGNWVFVRRHPSYDGLPIDQVMKWEYQVDYDNSSGLLVDGEGVEVFAGYGRDHNTTIGAATFSAKMGRGKILFQAVRSMQALVYRKFVQNALAFLTSGATTSNATSRSE